MPKTGFRLWVRRTRRCHVCGARNPDPHHVRHVGLGGTKDPHAVDERNVVPLCRRHHTAGGDSVHVLGKRTFAEHHGLGPLEDTAVLLWFDWLHLTPAERESWEAECA